MATIKDGKIFYTPDELGYQDRGKLKWMGMMLSDHTEALKQLKTDDEIVDNRTVEPQLSSADISHLLNESFVYQKPILIQANTIQYGEYYRYIPCIVLGYKEEYIYIKNIDGSESKFLLENIRHIKWMEAMEWYKKQPLPPTAIHD